jgi:nicotinamidase-related amidase
MREISSVASDAQETSPMTGQTKTLLELAGTPSHPSPLDASVLVIVDAQLEYVTGKLPLAGIEAAIGEAANLLALARRNAVPVIHVVQHSLPGRPLFDPATPFVEIVPALTPLEGEKIITKRLPNAFAGTRLHQALQEIGEATGRNELILAGFMTHMCISATARAALDLGIRATVVAAATATRDVPDPLGGIIPAGTVHRTALAELADRFAIVVPDAAALAAAAVRAA